MKHLILGGARSGKSRIAQQLAEQAVPTPYLIATAEAGDEEMAQRIARHQQDRPPHWVVCEQTIGLARQLQTLDAPSRCVVVDCLSLWLSNCLHQDCWTREREALMNCLPGIEAQVILVSNEVGMGIIPMGELSRRFVDEIGWLHQDLATLCDKVTLVTAGLPQTLKE
ncbi:bifunctional adenosylcobinamide kinase/adenosylcobinamide-phosphate guanylyltransferase [Halioglobus japonicus]|uniref:Bifunctional adenosylcobalamin biosynthesis protein n=1 Tax=Halioglobus japonicus TaxID=930805 RepID=A0AAP8MHH1_9GAMM|nr:bifunctional adenosylcobinamide kinase/adenosylcobinamide-phosphate guanylyltransferase [Halioglobus japonicus]AQA19190.1 bifunctional adenosylcobinamide kinase/adenosylcobinamide-phosphate guanylyltransferase [Halioglobus japonicus]PLW87774.1 bifunctional adenosylcobinamide kinase/adenosylcobinamide-phosphate guanylyltransferase [Halioglobus japonicus]GHD06643.1 bifunctional adenosylcobalamin biosynthesis protein CobP [Halioglobus japonicus]